MKTRREAAILFDGSLEGFLCIVHAYYYDGVSPLIIQVQDNYQQTLDSEEYVIQTDGEKAAKVQQGIRKKISQDAWYSVYYAFLAGYDDKYMAIFRYIILGFKVGAVVDDHLQQDSVLRVRKLSRYVGREAHLLTGFCRFAETEGQIYYCAISPVNYVLPILVEHFCDRMMNQSWIIHDKTYCKAAVYNGEDYIIAEVPASVQVKHSENEADIQNLWTTFFHSVTIKERINPKVQRNHLPLHFRKSMVEFQNILNPQ